jgi:hypothetical protein
MVMIDEHYVRGIFGSIGLVLSYGFSLWRIFERNRRDRFVEFALITTMLLTIMFAIGRLPNVPAWVIPALLPLLALFCFLSLFFLFQQGYHAFRDRKRNTSR